MTRCFGMDLYRKSKRPTLNIQGPTSNLKSSQNCDLVLLLVVDSEDLNYGNDDEGEDDF